MLFFGPSEEARYYSCRISIKNKFGIEFIYSGPVHSLDKAEKTIINSGFLLMIGPNAAKNLSVKENDLKIDVSIQKQNEAICKESQVFYEKKTDSDNDIFDDADRYRTSESDSD